MLPRNAVLGGVVLVVVAFYWKLWNVRVFKDESELLQQLQSSYRPATEPVVLMLGECFSAPDDTLELHLFLPFTLLLSPCEGAADLCVFVNAVALHRSGLLLHSSSSMGSAQPADADPGHPKGTLQTQR